MFLQAHFGDVSEPKRKVDAGEEDELLVLDVNVDDASARVDLISMVRLPPASACVLRSGNR
jgi:hypothetical protein